MPRRIGRAGSKIVELRNFAPSDVVAHFAEWFADPRVTHRNVPDAAQRVELIGPAVTIATAVELLEKLDSLDAR